MGTLEMSYKCAANRSFWQLATCLYRCPPHTLRMRPRAALHCRPLASFCPSRPWVVLHALEHLTHALADTQPVDQVDEVEVGQLAVQALHLHVEVRHLGRRELQVDGSLDRAGPGKEEWIMRGFSSET